MEKRVVNEFITFVAFVIAFVKELFSGSFDVDAGSAFNSEFADKVFFCDLLQSENWGWTVHSLPSEGNGEVDIKSGNGHKYSKDARSTSNPAVKLFRTSRAVVLLTFSPNHCIRL